MRLPYVYLALFVICVMVLISYLAGRNSHSTGKNTSVHARPIVAVVILFGGIATLLVSIVFSIALGATDISFMTVMDAIFSYDALSTQHQIIQELRIPRALTGAIVGACFATAGAIMQGMTRNPLADPGLLGINAGAGFALALCFVFFPGLPFPILVLASFAGAALGTLLVYGIGSLARGGLTPVRLALAGAAIAALLVALSEGISLYYRIGQDLAFWYAGGVAGTKWLHLRIMGPWTAIGMVGALLLSRSITLLSLGEDVAVSLGLHIGLVKILGSTLVLILAGTSVAAVGAIGFIGLVIPHIARALVGSDYRWIIPCSAVLGSLLVVIADMGGRMIRPPFETPVGALIALIGIPFFLYLARQERRSL